MGKMKSLLRNRTYWKKNRIIIFTIIINLLILIASVNAGFPDGTPGGSCNWDSDCSYNPNSIHPFVYPCHDYKLKCIENICDFVCPGDPNYENVEETEPVISIPYPEEESNPKIVTIEKELVETSETSSIEKNLSLPKIQEESQLSKEGISNKSMAYSPPEILDNKTTNESQLKEPILNNSFERIISFFKKILSWFD